MVAEIVIMCFALAFLVLGVFLLCGKGKGWIAGYNTASKEEQRKYDEKKLCRAAGCVCVVCAVMLCVMAYLGYRVDAGLMAEDDMLVFGLLFVAVIFAGIIVAILYMNTRAKK